MINLVSGLLRDTDVAGTRPASDAEIAAYDAPFPDDRYKAGARQFPALVPAAPDAGPTPIGATAISHPAIGLRLPTSPSP